jgi:hypothetical protein
LQKYTPDKRVEMQSTQDTFSLFDQIQFSSQVVRMFNKITHTKLEKDILIQHIQKLTLAES